MNLYKFIRITYNKIVFLVLSMFTTDFPPKLYYDQSINISNNNHNLISFTLKTLDYDDLKSLLLNFNNSNIISESHFLNCTPPNFIFLFDSDGKMFGSYEFHIHMPDNIEAQLAFNAFVVTLTNDIIKHCTYESMKNNVSFFSQKETNHYKFYMHISNKSIIIKKNKEY